MSFKQYLRKEITAGLDETYTEDEAWAKNHPGRGYFDVHLSTINQHERATPIFREYLTGSGKKILESLRQRLALLAGLDVNVLKRLAAELPLTEGAETLIRVLKQLGYRTAVVSGGFSIAAEALKARLGIDYAYSNALEVVGGKLTGKVLGPIVNARRKAELLEFIAQAEGVVLDQTIAVGDGANDLLMLEKAGLGIAFRAKKTLREKADTSLSATGLDAILYLLGISAEELQAVTGRFG